MRNEFISHSEISTYLECQKKWWLQYIMGLRVDNVHFQFGSMGHSALETRLIPDETLYPELKEAFKITSWKDYFTTIFTEVDELLKEYETIDTELKLESMSLKGVIDLVMRHKTTGRILLLDYKFSTSDRTLDDVYLDEQLYIYSILYHNHSDIALENIDIGFITIPKGDFDKPQILKKGGLSKAKSQKTTAKAYMQAIIDNNLNVADYEDILTELSGKQLIKFCVTEINIPMLHRVCENIDNVIKDMDKGYVLEKCSHMCGRCDVLQYCKYNRPIKETI